MYLGQFQTHEPIHYKEQQDSTQWLVSAYQKYSTPEKSLEKKLIERLSCKPPSILTRGSYIEDFRLKDQELFERAEIFQEAPAGSYKRMQIFQKVARNVINEFYQKRNVPQDLIHVSCTGYVSPSAAQEKASLENWPTTVTHSYHMGCYGAFPALRMAEGFLQSRSREVSCDSLQIKSSAITENSVQSKSSGVDIFHTELCTLHLNPVNPDLETVVIQSLFADGCVIYRAESEKSGEPQLQVIAVQEKIIADSLESMSWVISDHGMKMVLSKEVPDKIKAVLRPMLADFLKKNGEDLASFMKDGIFAIHPGGPRIIDSISDLLEINESQARHSRAILQKRGNMSSATLPYIWKEILDDPSVKSGTAICSMAFGPGLTVCLGLLKKV